VSRVIALIDADVVAYQSCASRHTGPIQLDAEGNKVMPVYTKEEDADYLRKSLDVFRNRLNEIAESCWADDFLAAVKSSENYRDTLYPEYKANRKKPEGLTNVFVPHIRKLAAIEELVVEAHGREADDMLRIWAGQCIEAGDEYVVCSNDKDLRCIPGKHFILDMFNPRIEIITEEDARMLYYAQLIKGDPVDNIPGIPRVGDVKAAKALKGCKTEEEFQEAVVAQYIDYFGDSWFHWFLSNAKMIHLQRHPNDYFNCREWPIICELQGLK
jgi:hypothetical protein